MHQSDFDKLDPGQCLNDVVVDFWTHWITRKEAIDEPYIRFFITQYYTAIVDFGVARVTKWTEKRSIDIFSKKNLVLPVHIASHWSLCAVYNAGQIVNFDENDDVQVEIPFILFLDPLDYHSRTAVCKNIRDW